jgi:hypothetical protein
LNIYIYIYILLKFSCTHSNKENVAVPLRLPLHNLMPPLHLPLHNLIAVPHHASSSAPQYYTMPPLLLLPPNAYSSPALHVGGDSGTACRQRRVDDGGGGAANGWPTLCVDGGSVSSLARHLNDGVGTTTSSRSVTLPYLGVPSSFVPLYRSRRSPTVP